jgi:hypothetical protein
LTPFEREYGKRDLPGAWLDGKALRRKLREVSVVRAGEEEEVEVVTTPAEEEGKGLEDEVARMKAVDKDIRITRLMVHPIKVSP